MRRHIIGIIALLLIIGALYFWIFPPRGAGSLQIEAACWRLGAFLSVLWMAYPEVHRMPAWFWAFLPVLVVVLAVRPRWFLVAVPIIVVLAILRPRIGKKRA